MRRIREGGDEGLSCHGLARIGQHLGGLGADFGIGIRQARDDHLEQRLILPRNLAKTPETMEAFEAVPGLRHGSGEEILRAATGEFKLGPLPHPEVDMTEQLVEPRGLEP